MMMMMMMINCVTQLLLLSVRCHTTGGGRDRVDVPPSDAVRHVLRRFICVCLRRLITVKNGLRRKILCSPCSRPSTGVDAVVRG